MFLKCNRRFKNGKEHRYWTIVESRRCAGGKVVPRPVLYLGEINDSQRESWCRTIQAFDPLRDRTLPLALFPADRPLPEHAAGLGVQVHLDRMELHRPRQWGACWLACQLYEQLGLNRFWAQRLPDSREGTCWRHILQTLVSYRLLDPGSEWRLHRLCFELSAMGDLLGRDSALVERNGLYRTLDKLLEHKPALFAHLQERWRDLFGAKFDVLLYDLTSTYFESVPPEDETDKRRFGHSRDKRPDCVQVVIGLIVTPEGFPLAYEVMAGNTSDKTTLKDFLEKIEKQYGKAQRIWVMDRGIPTEKTLEQMRASDPPVLYLVGTPKGRLSQLEDKLSELPWQQVREGIEVKLLAETGEVYVFAQSQDRVNKERSMRRRQLKRLCQRLKELQGMELKRDELLMKLGAARQQAPSAWRFVEIKLPAAKRKKKKRKEQSAPSFTFKLRRDKLRVARRREGRYLLRSNMPDRMPAQLWEFYLQLVQVEQAFKHVKGDLAVRPLYHQKDERIEAHIFVTFLAYCLHVTLGRRLKDLAPGLTPRSVLEKLGTMQMIDVHLPTTDGREVILTRYTQPEPDQRLLLEKLKLKLPEQPPPKITAKQLLGS